MSKPSNTSQPLAVQPVYLAAGAINSLIRALPAGTAYFIGIVLITMFTGQLVHQQGSLARALHGLAPRRSRNITEVKETTELQLPLAA